MSKTPLAMRSRYPQVLLLASRYDLTCDYVVAQLRRRAIPYLRLNSEDLTGLSIDLDPIERRLVIEREGQQYCLNPQTLKSVLFRRPVFLRDYGDDHRSPFVRFSRLQWAAFMRNLLIFQEARWFNEPAATYRAEHKALQLAVAAQLGFDVPPTRVTNAPRSGWIGNNCTYVAVKGLDTVLLRDEGYEMFGFTTFERVDKLEPEDWRAAPAIIQAALVEKLDIRVTVVEDKVFSASITVDGVGVKGDWRARKSRVRFSEFDLPKDVSERCRLLVQSLGLRFGAIDLALCDGKYYFLEINPTGEWAWLVDTAGLPIDTALAEALSEGGDFSG